MSAEGPKVQSEFFQGEGGDLEAVKGIAQARKDILGQMAKRIVGQQEVMECLLVALFARGHSLLVGVPGLAKTLLVRTLSEVLNLAFNRIQFTPDLMPSDITGTDVLQEDHVTGKRQFAFIRGPIFCNLLLADEINRTPPKTQAALLQAMQEQRVTAGGATYTMAEPFLVFATQNPIEQEGTYPLPEAQLDRFMLHIQVDYPDETDEISIVRTTTCAYQPQLQKVLDGQTVVSLQNLVLKVPVADSVIRYAVNLCRATRPNTGLSLVREYVSWGAGPRAAQHLILASKARAVLYGRANASLDDVQALAVPVLRHRIITNFKAEAEGLTSVQIVEAAQEAVGKENHG